MSKSITYIHQELMEQVIVLTMAVLNEDQVDIEDFVEWAKDSYMTEEDVFDLMSHHIRGDLNDILATIRKERKKSW